MSSQAHVSLESARMTNAPYAGPSARPTAPHVSAAGSPRSRPYVPAPWRTSVPSDSAELALECSGELLPPISEFLAEGADTSAAGTLDVVGTQDSVSYDRPSFDDYLASASDETPNRVDDWPFADAGAATAELTAELRAPDSAPPATSQSLAAASHSMWSDDDLLDIMPTPVQLSPADATWSPGAPAQEAGMHGANARREGSGSPPLMEHRESAARALEGLAHRIRSGELVLPGYVPELGDAAALAAALAALLGIRRG